MPVEIKKRSQSEIIAYYEGMLVSHKLAIEHLEANYKNDTLRHLKALRDFVKVTLEGERKRNELPQHG